MFLSVEIYFKNVYVTFQSTRNLKILQIVLLFKYLCVQDSLKDQKSEPDFYSDFERCDCRRTTTLGSGEKQRQRRRA